MLRPYLLFLRLSILASAVLPFAALLYNVARWYHQDEDAPTSANLAFKGVALILLCIPVVWAILLPRRRWLESIERASEEQGKFLDMLPVGWVDLAILFSAGVSLLLELSLIRWQGETFEVFAFYKNFGLLSCFLGLGLGYALSSRQQIPLILVMPALAWQIIVLTICHLGPEGWNNNLFRAMPAKEQLHMGFQAQPATYRYVSVIVLLLIVLMLTALALIPVGQLCGRLLDRRPKLRAYGLNLLGSLLGVATLFALSLLWTAPIVWFGLSFLALLLFQAYNFRPLLWGAIATIAAMIALTWPTPMWEQIHSPYQLLERGPSNFGLTVVRAAGSYYQRIHDFSSADRDPRTELMVKYYSVPYQIHNPPGRVAIVGAGTGNDVAMALRMGAEHVDAIEIDPAILDIGKKYHPESPYSSEKVTPIVNDARSFLRTTDNQYDMIVYGLLDSHTLLSHGSNVRLDSFVYTTQAFREAREKLKDGGILSLAFAVITPELGRKIYLMLEEAFDGVPPVCIQSRDAGAVIFLERKGGGQITIPPGLIDDKLFENATSFYGDPALQADVSTDDWPFFYMPKRVYPMSYVIVLGLILIVSAILVFPFFREASPHFGQIEFFLLGAGFMLVETKGITELGLTFGNTWHVIGIVIAGILFMAFLANLVVAKFEIRSLKLPYICLLASLLVGGLLIAKVGFPPTMLGKLLAVVVLTCPLFFSGMVFSTLLQSSKDVSGAMASNLIGAMFGGLLEYNSMYFGFLFLYWLAIAIYGAAFLTSMFRKRAGTSE